MRISAVIGANYGDEGKGLVTDWLCDHRTLNIRHNGGAQAGHTVIDFDNPSEKHVFSHLGAGTFRSAITALGCEFVVNPMLFRKEQPRFACKPYIDPQCMVTNPFDILINQAIEKKRSTQRHGSCGVGFNETIERSLKHLLTYRDIDKLAYFEYKVRRLRDSWVPKRCDELKIDVPDLVYDEVVLQKYMDDVRFIRDNSTTFKTPLLIDNWFGSIVFEGAQGLLLSMDNIDDFPHLTRSFTGMGNIKRILNHTKYDLSDVDAYYVTRTYLTRHGAGPLPNEIKRHIYGDKNKDTTNVTNTFQGEFRYAYPDLDVMLHNIRKDTSGYKFKSVSIVITHCDQLQKGMMMIVERGRLKELPLREVCEFIARITGYKVYTSHGPTADHIRQDF